MQYRFYINDIEVDEPVGFDATKVTLKRSEMWHGVMVETSDETMEFYGGGFQILKGLYDASGIDAVAVLRIDYLCDSEVLDSVSYNITFYEYAEYCGDDCYCSVGIERTGCFYKFRNAMDTKVNLDAVKSIDKVTDLVDYEYLGKEIEVPSKTIVLTNLGKINEEQYQEWQTDVSNTFTYPSGNYEFFIFPALEQTFSEIDEFDTNALTEWWLNPETEGEVGAPFFVFNNSFTGICNDNTEFRITGRMIFDFYSDISGLAANPTIKIAILKRKVDTSYEVLYTGSDLMVNVGNIHSCEADVTFDTTETIDVGEELLFSILFNFGALGGTLINEMNIRFYPESYLQITNNSLCDATNCKTYMVNETLSHISEYVTDNCLRVYSEYLGRNDSQPFNFDNDGCGGMLALTNGLFLRRLEYTNTADEQTLFSLSFNDVLNAVNSIYPLGFTVENNGDIEVLRIENWEYFYNDTILFDIGTVAVKKEPNLALHFKNYKTGYSKYEAEEFNGLDEFLTEREYTTNLVNHNQQLDKICQFIASGYAIETTRRKGNSDSKDWRFDNDTFILAVERGAYNTIEVEQGNITDAENIIDADTVLNFRLSPARMAMNWFRYLMTFKKSLKELLFSSGKGNISAGGQLVSSCSIDTGVILENQNLTQNDINSDVTQLFDAELHTIDEFNLTFRQYLTFKNNPHGLMSYNCGNGTLYGWIKELKYNNVEGVASAIIIPKNVA